MVQVLGHGTGEHAPGYTGQGTLVYQVVSLDIDSKGRDASNLDKISGKKKLQTALETLTHAVLVVGCCQLFGNS